MTKDEKLSKVLQDFSTLPEEKQNYVLGILQALVFACSGREETKTCPEKTEETAKV